MKLHKLLSLLFVVTLLIACSKSGEEEDGEHFASPQQRALEKSKQVEGLLQDSEEKRRKQLEQSEQ